MSSTNTYQAHKLILGAITTLALLIALNITSSLWAADPLGGGGQGPISISADHMSADENSKIVTFTGRVIARQDDLIITCDLMRVHYQQVSQNGGNTKASSNQETEVSLDQNNDSSPSTSLTDLNADSNSNRSPNYQASQAGRSGDQTYQAEQTYQASQTDQTYQASQTDQTYQAAQNAQAAQAPRETSMTAPSSDGLESSESLQTSEALDSSAASPTTAASKQESDNPLNGSQEIYRVDCEGSVKVQQGDKLGVGQKALYLAKSQPRRLILTGEARIWEGNNSVTGHQVVYYLDQNRSQVESRDNGRVRAYIHQDGESK
ncbi:MAG: hypothetical protein LBE31_03225 [Deltaproteobacteria bacterium]|nr:hypothetical protein [Deltaproteobacteria bacterium]